MWWLVLLFLVGVDASSIDLTTDTGKPLISNICFIPNAASASKPYFHLTYTFPAYTGAARIYSYRIQYILRDKVTGVVVSGPPKDMIIQFTTTPYGTCSSADTSTQFPKVGTLYFPWQDRFLGLNTYELQLRMKLGARCTWSDFADESAWSDWYQADPTVQSITWLNQDTYMCPAPAIQSVCQIDGPPDLLHIEWAPVQKTHYPTTARIAVFNYQPEGGEVVSYRTPCFNTTTPTSFDIPAAEAFGSTWNSVGGRLAINFYSSCPLIDGATVLSEYWQGNTTDLITLNKCPVVLPCDGAAITDVACQVYNLTGIDQQYGLWLFIGALLVLAIICIGLYFAIVYCCKLPCCNKNPYSDISNPHP